MFRLQFSGVTNIARIFWLLGLIKFNQKMSVWNKQVGQLSKMLPIHKLCGSDYKCAILKERTCALYVSAVQLAAGNTFFDGHCDVVIMCIVHLHTGSEDFCFEQFCLCPALSIYVLSIENCDAWKWSGWNLLNLIKLKRTCNKGHMFAFTKQKELSNNLILLSFNMPAMRQWLVI